MPLTLVDAGKRLGVTKQRIAQLRDQGRLRSLEPADVDAYARNNAKKQAYYAERAKRGEKRDAAEDEFRRELLDELRTLNRNVLTLSAALAAATAASTIAR